MTVDFNNNEWIIGGNLCKRGREFAISEITHPKRSLCTTVKTVFKGIPRLPVRTDNEIPLEEIFNVMKHINMVTLNQPVHTGEVVIENVCNTGANVIATSDAYEQLREVC